MSEIQFSQSILNKQPNSMSLKKHSQHTMSLIKIQFLKKPQKHAFLHHHILLIPSLKENTGNKECKLPPHDRSQL